MKENFENILPDNQLTTLHECRRRIESTRKDIDDLKQREFTDEFAGLLVDRITGVVTWIRTYSKEEDFEAGKKAVLKYLREARIKLNTAFEEYNKKKVRTEKFYRLLEGGGEFLDDALHAW